jgi:hypothetical protein
MKAKMSFTKTAEKETRLNKAITQANMAKTK